MDLQSDVSCLVSKGMFDEYFLPFIGQQTLWAERTVYHLDGPAAIRHLDSLLSLPRLTAVQWVAGAGAPSAAHWIPLARGVLAAGKRRLLDCEPGEVRTLVQELGNEGLMLSTRCASEEEARGLLASMPRWTRR